MIQIVAEARVSIEQMVRTVGALVLREMATSYGRSPGGYVWAAAEPIAGIALLTLIFSLSFHAPPIGNSFALFYATGLLPFLLYSDLSGKLSQAINFSLPLLSYPRVTIFDTLFARLVLNVITQCLVVLVVFSSLLLLIGINASIDLYEFSTALWFAFFLGMGVGTFNCYMITRFPVWQRVWSILNRPMFLISCIVFTFESVPKFFQDILWYNPIIHIVGMMRQAVFFGYNADYISKMYLTFFSSSFLALGMLMLWLSRDKLLNR